MLSCGKAEASHFTDGTFLRSGCSYPVSHNLTLDRGEGGCKVIQAQLSDMVLFFRKIRSPRQESYKQEPGMHSISFPHGGHARDSAYRSIGVYSSHTLGRARAPSERLDLHVLDGLAGQAVLHIPHVSHMVGMQRTQHSGLLASTRRTDLGRDKWPPIHWT